MPKRKAQSPIPGRWRIDWMSMWDVSDLEGEFEPFVEFGDDDLGKFRFGEVHGDIDYRLTQRDGKPAVEFSWEGGDAADGTPLTGRGWAVLDGDELKGMHFIHRGDQSEFVASKTD